MYVSNKLRQKLATLFVVVAAVDELKQREEESKEVFGPKAWGWVKQAASLIEKALSEGARAQIGQAEMTKLDHVIKTSKIVLLRKSEVLPPSEINVKYADLLSLAELAMGKECLGCTKTSHKECPLFHALHQMEIPEANEEKGQCPYLQ